MIQIKRKTDLDNRETLWVGSYRFMGWELKFEIITLDEAL